jgi:hypothetical protein
MEGDGDSPRQAGGSSGRDTGIPPRRPAAGAEIRTERKGRASAADARGGQTEAPWNAAAAGSSGWDWFGDGGGETPGAEEEVERDVGGSGGIGVARLRLAFRAARGNGRWEVRGGGMARGLLCLPALLWGGGASPDLVFYSRAGRPRLPLFSFVRWGFHLFASPPVRSASGRDPRNIFYRFPGFFPLFPPPALSFPSLHRPSEFRGCGV